MANDNIIGDIVRGVKSASTTIGYIYAGELLHYNSEMRRVVEDYKEEFLQWFAKGYADSENPLKQVTQEHWYNLYLEKKRLEKSRCKVEYEEYKHISRNSLENPETSFLYKPDGKYLSCMAEQPTKIKKKYIRDTEVIHQEQKTYNVKYFITRSQNKDGLYICPNCGAEQSKDTLLDGCDYCKSKYDISVYDDKVMSTIKDIGIMTTREYDNSEDHTPIIVYIIEIIGVLAIFAGIVFALFTLGLSLIISLVGLLLVGLCLLIAIYANRNVKYPATIKMRLQDYNPGFSEEEFIGSLDCKLKSIHYASEPQDVVAFVKCDIAPYIENYQNILNCETGRIAYKDFRTDEHYQYVDLHREIMVMYDYGDHVTLGRGVAKVTLAKKLNHKLKNEVSMYRCNCCGSTISLVEGGKCKYCGNELDYASYDWIVVDYKHVKEL